MLLNFTAMLKKVGCLKDVSLFQSVIEAFHDHPFLLTLSLFLKRTTQRCLPAFEGWFINKPSLDLNEGQLKISLKVYNLLKYVQNITIFSVTPLD